MSDAVAITLRAVAADVALDLASQPELFAPVTDPRVPEPFVALLSRRPHTGERVTNDPAKVAVVAALRTLGWSDRRIAAAAGVARESIGPILEHAERTGVVRPLKDRVAGLVGLLAEEAAAASRELVQAVRDGERDEGVTMALRALGPMLGISVEKMQLLTGSPTEILETREARSADAEAAFLAQLRDKARAELEARTVDVTPSADSESASQPGKCLPINASPSGDTACDTAQPAQDPVATPAGSQAPAAQGAGGGIDPAGTMDHVEGSRGSEISAHGGNAQQPKHQ